MQIIYLLIPLSIMFCIVAVWAIRYAIRTNQFDDLDNAAQKIILEDKQLRREQLLQTTKPTSKLTKQDNP